MPRFRLPHSRGNVRGLKKEEEDKVSLFYSEPFRKAADNKQTKVGLGDTKYSKNQDGVLFGHL